MTKEVNLPCLRGWKLTKLSEMSWDIYIHTQPSTQVRCPKQQYHEDKENEENCVQQEVCTVNLENKKWNEWEKKQQQQQQYQLLFSSSNFLFAWITLWELFILGGKKTKKNSFVVQSQTHTHIPPVVQRSWRGGLSPLKYFLFFYI